jgi:hypothetical protein
VPTPGYLRSMMMYHAGLGSGQTAEVVAVESLERKLQPRALSSNRESPESQAGFLEPQLSKEMPSGQLSVGVHA